MEVSSIGGLLRKDQSLERNCIGAIDAHNFALRIRSRNYFDGILRQFENFCEQPLQFAVRRTFDRWRSNLHLQRAIMFADDFAARCARHDKYIKGETSTVLRMANQDW
jgi:hypothetical protein